MSVPLSSDAASELLRRDLKLAFFDIDGTLVGLDANYSARVKQALAALRAAGVKLAVASGRPRFAAQFLIDELGLDAAGLFNTGALLYEPASGNSLVEHPLNAELCRSLVEAAAAANIYTEVYTAEHYYTWRMTSLAEIHAEHLRIQPDIADLASLAIRESALKLIFAVEKSEDHESLYALERQFPEAEFAYARMVSRPDYLFASVISRAACKQQGFEQLLAYHQVEPAQVIAFGDARSDRVFLQQAGVGVAMGNAEAGIRDIAKIETLPVWDDGVAAVIERWITLNGL